MLKQAEVDDGPTYFENSFQVPTRNFLPVKKWRLGQAKIGATLGNAQGLALPCSCRTSFHPVLVIHTNPNVGGRTVLS